MVLGRILQLTGLFLVALLLMILWSQHSRSEEAKRLGRKTCIQLGNTARDCDAGIAQHHDTCFDFAELHGSKYDVAHPPIQAADYASCVTMGPESYKAERAKLGLGAYSGVPSLQFPAQDQERAVMQK